MEALWNYFYWQTLSINMLDDTSHMLRASLTAAPDCINFRNTPPKTEADRTTFERCNAYLGPNQPGIISFDPLDDGKNPQAAALRRERRAGGQSEQRGEGQPEAGPLPGQPDLSRPQVTLPPELEELLDSLTPTSSSSPRSTPVSPRTSARGAPEPDRGSGSQVAPASSPTQPASSSTSCSRHEPAPSRDSLHRRQPGPDRGGHVLVALVAVFIAYNANAGLPFVPTYELKAELPSGAKLVKGNEVRIGGFRVGVVDDITPKVTTIDGAPRSVAVANLKLDKKIEPLAVDSRPARGHARRSGSSTSSSHPARASAAGPPATPSRSSCLRSRSSTRTSSRPSTATRARTSRPPRRASATRSRGAASRSTARSRRSTRSSARSRR